MPSWCHPDITPLVHKIATARSDQQIYRSGQIWRVLPERLIILRTGLLSLGCSQRLRNARRVMGSHKTPRIPRRRRSGGLKGLISRRQTLLISILRLARPGLGGSTPPGRWPSQVTNLGCRGGGCAVLQPRCLTVPQGRNPISGEGAVWLFVSPVQTMLFLCR